VGAFPVLAQSEGEARLQPITVTATRSPSRVTDLVSEVSVIDRQMLDRLSGRTLVEVLSSQPGIQFASNGGLGKNSSLFIRGLDPRHTLLLIDGMRLGSATTGAPSLDNLPLEAIESIEIVRGPMSALYGSDAVGGVIQVFTRRGREGVHPNAKATVGSNRYGQFVGGVAMGEGSLDAAVRVQHTETRGFSTTPAGTTAHDPDDDGFRQHGGSVRLGWQATSDWRVEGQALETNGLSHFDDGRGVDSRAHLRNRLLSMRATGRMQEGVRTTLSAAQSVDEFDTLASSFSVGEIKTVQRQFSWETTLATPAGTALALLERIDQHVSRPGTPFTVSDRTINAAALGLNGSEGRHTWQASIRRDHNSQFGGQTTGAFGWGVEVAPRWRVGASAGTSFVAPSFNQLYFPNFGNPNLLAEEGTHGELMVQWSGEQHSVRAAWFDNRIDNYITTTANGPRNIGRARIDGVTLSYEGQLGPLSVVATLDHLEPRNAKPDAPNDGKQLPRRAKNAGRVQADWTTGLVTLGAAVMAFSERFDNASNTVRLPGYATLDLHAEWKFAPDWQFAARLNNLADKHYETARGFNQPGREAYLSVRYAPR
jgi:vitamin B12 transporter